MSKPRYRWWGYVKSVIRAYPELCRELEALRQPSTTAAYGPVGGHSGTGRPAEQAAMKRLPLPEQREYEAVQAAIRDTKQLPDGALRLKIIDLVFWKQSHTLQGAALEVHWSYESAKRKQRQFVESVAGKLGLLERINHKSQKTVLK